MKRYILLFCVLFAVIANAQTGIGTTTPEASAKLDVYSTNKGFLPPRVTLTSGTDTTTIPSPATGLLVYNTGNNVGLVAGYYYWNGSSWATIATATGSGVSSSYVRGSRTTAQTTGLSANGLVAFTQVDQSAGQDISLNTSTGQITLAAGRTYRLQAQVPTFQTSASDARPQFGWYNETTGTYVGSSAAAYSGASSAGYGATGGLSDAVITTTTQTVVSYRIIQTFNTNQLGANGDFSATGSYPWFNIQVISGNLPVNQHMAERNFQLNSNYISNDGGNEGIRIDNSGNVGIGTTSPAVALDVNGALNLSNTTTTPSITVKNGDAALAYGDNAQIKMGWAGSPAGTSQYAQYIHTRHNAGPTENGIDFYLSDGTPNNTITNGSKRAMSITSPGDVDITGKLTIGNPSGNVSTKLVGRVTAGTFLTFENLKFSVTTSGQRGLSIATVSGTVNLYVEGKYNNGNAYGSRTDTAVSYTTTPSGSPFGWGFLSAGDTIIYHLTDADNSRMYRVTLIIMPSYINNFIAVERLL
jgi:hypothetical protein